MNGIGIIGYNTNTGLGNIIKWFKIHLPNVSHWIIEHLTLGHKIETAVPYFLTNKDFNKEDIEFFIKEYDIGRLLIIETPFNIEVYETAHKLGVKIFVIPMADAASIETFRPYLQYITAFLCPTKWCYEFYCDNQKECTAYYLPIPTDTDYFKLNGTAKKALFLHNQGNGGAHFRKGSDLIYTAFKNLSTECTIWVNQQPDLHPMYKLAKDLPNMTINGVDYIEQIDAYRQGSIYIAPSRREGLGLPILEAMSCGLPVITTNAPPMNEWFPKDYPLLVEIGGVRKAPTGDIPYYLPKVTDLYEKIIWACENWDTTMKLGEINRKIIEDNYSWKILKQQYLDILLA